MQGQTQRLFLVVQSWTVVRDWELVDLLVNFAVVLHISGDKGLLAAFLRRDLHRPTGRPTLVELLSIERQRGTEPEP